MQITIKNPIILDKDGKTFILSKKNDKIKENDIINLFFKDNGESKQIKILKVDEIIIRYNLLQINHNTIYNYLEDSIFMDEFAKKIGFFNWDYLIHNIKGIFPIEKILLEIESIET